MFLKILNIASLVVAKEKTERAQFTSDLSAYDDGNNETQKLSVTSKQFDNNSKPCYSRHNLGLNIKSKKRQN